MALVRQIRSQEGAWNLGANGLDLGGATALHALSPAELYELSLARGESYLASSGGLVVDTGAFTGRSPKDKFVVRNALAEPEIDWGPVNQPLAPERFELLLADMQEHLAGRELLVQDLVAGADASHRRRIRVITERAWHSLFASNLFLPADAGGEPDWLVVDLPSFKADPQRHGSRSTTVIAMDFARRLILIADTEYGGEIKKSIFTALNFELPREGVFPMHCSANEDEQGNVALYFGLSGTGKTTLSSDSQRRLIGDDEHGWSDAGIFNFEGGCYAKVSGLSAAAEPEIYAASNRFGAVLENVVFQSDSRAVDFDDISKTENTRCAYPIHHMPNASGTGSGSHPRDVFFLSADAFGVLPPIARLTPAQAMYYFLSGYTAKVAGTERGVTEPTATFSACFGSPFMPLPAVRYARMLGERLERHGSRVWLVNTGWTGGGHGVGTRMRLADTRALVRAALKGELDGVAQLRDQHFGLYMPRSAPGVDPRVLDPSSAWNDGDGYSAAAQRLVAMFRENFKRFAAHAGEDVVNAGPPA